MNEDKDKQLRVKELVGLISERLRDPQTPVSEFTKLAHLHYKMLTRRGRKFKGKKAVAEKATTVDDIVKRLEQENGHINPIG